MTQDAQEGTEKPWYRPPLKTWPVAYLATATLLFGSNLSQRYGGTTEFETLREVVEAIAWAEIGVPALKWAIPGTPIFLFALRWWAHGRPIPGRVRPVITRAAGLTDWKRWLVASYGVRAAFITFALAAWLTGYLEGGFASDLNAAVLAVPTPFRAGVAEVAILFFLGITFVPALAMYFDMVSVEQSAHGRFRRVYPLVMVVADSMFPFAGAVFLWYYFGRRDLALSGARPEEVSTGVFGP